MNLRPATVNRMKYYDSVLDLVGHTPLVKLHRMVDDSMADLYVKMEHLNPTGSVKDRMAVHMIRQAEEAGLIKPGATIVESTSGNTGLSPGIQCRVSRRFCHPSVFGGSLCRGVRVLKRVAPCSNSRTAATDFVRWNPNRVLHRAKAN